MRTAPPLLVLLALGCRRDGAAPAPRPRATDAPRVTAPAAPPDATPPRPPRGLAATLMACSPARRSDAGGGWTLTMRFVVFNQSDQAMPLRAAAVEVRADERVAGDLSAPGAFEGPATVAPGARVDMTLRPVFPPSTDPPVSVSFSFDSVGGQNHPIAFPIPSGP